MGDNHLDAMSPDIAHRLSTAVDQMPAFPQSVQKILTLTRDVNCTPKDLVDVIDKDPIVAVKVLKVVNSSHYSLPRPVTSMGQAVVYLGFNTIKNLAVSIATVDIMPFRAVAGFDIQQYLLHSLSTASLSKQLAQRLGTVDPTDCYMAGLLHDFGKVVLAHFMPDAFEAALAASQRAGSSLHDAVRAQIGVDHAAVGAMLAEKWRFAPTLIETVRHQCVSNFKDSDMISCVFAANQISKKLRHGFGGNPTYDELPAPVQQRFGGSLDQIIAKWGDLNPVLEEAKLFAKL